MNDPSTKRPIITYKLLKEYEQEDQSVFFGLTMKELKTFALIKHL